MAAAVSITFICGRAYGVKCAECGWPDNPCTFIGRPSPLTRIHRVLTGQTVSPTELRVAGAIVLLWFLMDAIEWSDWLLHWR